MRFLLDSHIFLWFISGDSRLPETARTAVSDSGNQVFLSVASVWEMMIKSSLGKLPLPEPAATYLPRQRDRHEIASLNVEEADVLGLAALPDFHRDPFDRLIVAQAIRGDLTIMSADRLVLAYPATFFSLG